MADALAAGQQAVGELPGLEPRVAGHALEPAHAVACRALQLQGFRLALLLIGRQCAWNVGAAGRARDQGDGVLHRELGAGADREVRRVGGVADQHAIAVVPASAQHALESEPGRAAQVRGVAHERVAVEVFREHPAAECDRLVVTGLVEAVCTPGFLARLDDDGREGLAELVGVDLEPAVRGFLERESECRERLRRPEPDVAALAGVEVGLEKRFVALARAAVDAIGGDDQVGVGEGRVVLHLVLEVMHDPEVPAPLLEETEQALPLDAAEAVAAGRGRRAAVVDVDVVPVVEAAGDRLVRGRVGGPEVLHRAVGEHDAPAEGVVRPVALVDLHPGPRRGLAEQQRGVQARRPAAHADDALHGIITGLNS